ncbi:unnamed protein product [Leptosia nina]|uniref:Nucleoporin NUP42 n=1 Tax=Leptosia nina TaxID=320188 RepID=A0AAV1JM95_9NEOP
MVVCRYFLQGSCRFGQNCRFEHTYSSKYSYQAPTANVDQEVIQQVKSDIQESLYGGQWILSYYSPFKGGCFPGLNNFSQEEARLMIYEAKANNTLDQTMLYMNSLYNDNKQKYQQILEASPSIVKVLTSLYKGEPVSSPFENKSQVSQGFGSQATSIFRSAVQSDPFNQTKESVFSRLGNQNVNASDVPKSIFAQATHNIFGPSQPPPAYQPPLQNNSTAKSIFAQASHNTFNQPQQSVFTNNQQSVFTASPPKQNIFATNQVSHDVFANNQQQQSVFTKTPENPFGVQQNTITRTNAEIFGITKNAFEQSPDDDDNVYSKIESLSPSDLEAFNSSDFKLGFIPELPPPHSLCI